MSLIVPIKQLLEKLHQPLLLNNLTQISWKSTETNTQQIWNEIENKLLKVVDLVAPMVEFKNTSHHKAQVEYEEEAAKKLKTTINKDEMKNRINNLN